MTLTVNGFTVTINAKHACFTRREATVAFLNELACMAWDAKARNDGEGYEAIGRSNKRYAIAFGDAWKELEGGNA